MLSCTKEFVGLKDRRSGAPIRSSLVARFVLICAVSNPRRNLVGKREDLVGDPASLEGADLPLHCAVGGQGVEQPRELGSIARLFGLVAVVLDRGVGDIVGAAEP